MNEYCCQRSCILFIGSSSDSEPPLSPTNRFRSLYLAEQYIIEMQNATVYLTRTSSWKMSNIGYTSLRSVICVLIFLPVLQFCGLQIPFGRRRQN